jgi:hypothetical protein
MPLVGIRRLGMVVSSHVGKPQVGIRRIVGIRRLGVVVCPYVWITLLVGIQLSAILTPQVGIKGAV